MTTGIPTAGQVAAARRGEFTAEFPCHAYARQFADRLAGGDFWVTDVALNRRNGRIVTFKATGKAWTCNRLAENPDRTQGITGYWLDMADTVGYYGSTPGEPPFHTGARTAYLNGHPCPPEY